MIRTLMASTALLAFVTTGALAQQQPADQTQTQQPQAQQGQQAPQGVQQQQQQGEVLAEDLMGKTVYSGQTEDAESVGDIEDLVLDADGNVSAVVIGVGGFLGIGQKDVAINFEELQFSQDQDGELRIVVSATQEQLEAAPEFEETDQTRLYGGMTEEERQTARVPQQQQEPQDRQAAQQPDQQAQDQQAAQQPDQQAQDQQTTVIEPETTDQQDQDQQMAQQPEQDSPEQQTTVIEPETTDQQGQDQQMAQQPEQDSPEQQTTVIEPESADQQAQAQQGQQQDQQVAFVEAPEQGESRASDWIGKQIVTAEDEEVGEVQDLLVDENGMTEAVIVDVSGFVESEKQVAIPFDAIQVEQQDGQEDVRLVANLSQEELQQAPAFQPEQATAQRQQGQDQQAQQQDQQDQQQMAQQPDQQSVTGGAQERQAARAPGVEQTVSGLSADQLMGANVIGANDEEIGQVNDVIFSQDGQIRAVVVDVGGFLGIGAKEVAIEFDAAQVQRQEGDELALMIPATEQQLEQAPEYQEQGGQQGQQPGGQQQPQAQPDQEPGEQPRQQ